MTADATWVGAAMAQRVPWVRAAGITVEEATEQRAVARLPDAPDLHNHLGGPHAAMIFGLGETASGAVGLAAFGGGGGGDAVLKRATPLVVRSEIGYRRLARGPLTAVAVLDRAAADVRADLAAGRRPEFTVTVSITDAEDRETARMTVLWTLRANR